MYLDHNKLFIISTNVSGQALGAVLSQKRLDRRKHPVVYANQPTRVITEPKKKTILFNMYSNLTAGHFYKEAIMKKTRNKYYWPSIRGGIRPNEPLRPIKVRQPFECIGIDLNLFIPLVLFAYRMIKQDTTQATLFKLVYSKKTTLPVEIEVNTYPTKPITEDNFQKTLLRKTYDLMETLKNKWQRAVKCGEKRGEEEERVKKLDRRQKQLYTTYLVLKLEKIKESLAHVTKLPETKE
ncbi:hypothetical protein G9A89_001600 [Geosiphon pyriformis]|nr:hypothetical protein G9A89_001600 [Geosiphon pyriformis]